MQQLPLEFHGPGQQVLLSQHFGVPLLEGAVDREVFPVATQVRVEVLFQPRRDNKLPLGLPVLLHQEALPLSGEGRWGNWRLLLPPRIPLDQALRCHYRVTPVTQKTPKFEPRQTSAGFQNAVAPDSPPT